MNELEIYNFRARIRQEVCHRHYRIPYNSSNVKRLTDNYLEEEYLREEMIINEEYKYFFLEDKAFKILDQVNTDSRTNLWRYKNEFCYRPNYNDALIVGTKEEIALEIGSRFSCNIKFVEDLNKIRTKDIRKIGINTIHIAINFIPAIDEKIFDVNTNEEIIIRKDGKCYKNLLRYTPYLTKGLYENACINQRRSFLRLFLKNLTIIKSEFILNWLGTYFITLKGSQDILVLMGDKVLSEEIIYRKVLNPIFGYEYCISITQDVLETQSIEEILKYKLFFNITYIPDNENDLKKLKEIIHSILLKSYQKPNNESIKVFGQILITLDSPHTFINEIINSCKIFFLKSMKDIKEVLNIKDEITLYKGIADNLDLFSDELNYFGRKTYNIEDFEVNNKDFLDEIEKISPKEIVSNQEVLLNIDNLDLFISLFDRYKHTYITGQSGSGKTEFMKTLFLSYIDKNDSSIIGIEPHGDLGLEIGKNIKDKDRLIFIDPTLDSKKTPTINIFDLEETNESIIMQTSRMIISIVKDINDDDKFSETMSDVLENCIPVLLRKGKSSFKELHTFMNDKKNKDLVELGKKSPNDLEREYFEDKFSDSSLSVTKEAVARRLKKFLNDEIFSNLMNGKSTINLEKEMNTKGKIIIFRIPKNKMLDTYKYYARFILGLIQIIALKRADLKENDRVHTHLFIDEFHNFITPTIEEILTESRKYKLFLTLAHQSISQISNSKLRDIILSNTNVKIIGKNSNKTLEVMDKTLNEKLKNVENLDTGEFYIKAGISPSIKVKNSDEFIGDKNSISEEEWNESKKYQLKHYYRDIKVINESNEVDKKIDEFIEAIVSKNQSYFKKIKETDETLYEELIYNFDDENGFIAQPLLSKYFNIINEDNNFSDNKIFLQKLKEKNIFFNQDVDKNKTYKSKKRYLL